MKSILNKKRKGAAAFEWVILSPAMIMSFMLILYVMFMGMAYIQFNNLANVMAQDLNMRQTGYESTQSIAPPTMTFNTKQESLKNSNFRKFMGGFTSKGNKVTMVIKGNSDTIRRSLGYSVKRNQSRFWMPGVSVSEVSANAIRNGRPASNFKNVSMSGTIIETTIKYKCFGGQFIATGYNIIS